MSYRAFKRLLGETSLERKCRFLFGGFILLLITASFWLYSRQTESLAYDQIPTMSRLLVNQIVARQIATTCRQPEHDDRFVHHRGALGALLAAGQAGPLPAVPALAAALDEPLDVQRSRALDEFRDRWVQHWPEHLKEAKYDV